ncbi:MAG: radical SAM protein [Desulfobacterales bacterium]
MQATRGCPYSCAFCTVPVMNPGLRKRPIEDVVRDMSYDAFGHWWQRKVVWFWDDNLTIDRQYSKALLTAMKPLQKWWLTQASVDIAQDDELLTLMKDSGCIGIFLGLETFGEHSLRDAKKKQNSVTRYKQAVKALHAQGIAVMAGFISGFDHDTYDSIVKISHNLMKQVGPGKYLDIENNEPKGT